MRLSVSDPIAHNYTVTIDGKEVWAVEADDKAGRALVYAKTPEGRIQRNGDELVLVWRAGKVRFHYKKQLSAESAGGGVCP